MAENKNSFILYADMIHTVRKMPKLKRAELFMTILEYVNDENPTVEDLIVSLVWEPIKHQLKRDLKDWEVSKKDRSNSGKLGNLKRWNTDLYEQVLAGEIDIEKAVIIANDRKASHSDKNVSHRVAKIAVNVNDNVTVNVNDIKLWTDAKKTFLCDGPWQLKFITEKRISLEELDLNMNEFIADLDLREDYKDVPELRNHFTNWFNKKQRSSLKVDFKKEQSTAPRLKRAN